MNILAILNSPWAILPDNYLEIREIYLRHSRGEKPDIAAIQAQLGRPLQNERLAYSIENPGPDGRGTAVIPIQGVIAKRMNLFMEISGGTSTRLLALDLRQAVADPKVHSILLVFDSPGGQVDGVQEIAREIRAVRGVKPIIALADGMAASAAYWMASAADAIYAASDTTQVGSIGVVAQHRDITKADEMQGLKVTLVTSGGEKGLLNEHVPLTPESMSTLKKVVDQICGIFVSEVAANRGTSVQDVLDRMAGGRLFIGEEAQKAGLIDGILSRDQVLAQLAARAAQIERSRPVIAAAGIRIREIQSLI
jgi:signal peptide peptidase SppA